MKLSILFPQGTEQSASAPKEFEDVCDELCLKSLVTGDIASYYTTDRDVICRRLDAFADIAEFPDVTKALSFLTDKLREYGEYRSASKLTDTETMFRQIVDARFYIELIETLSSYLSPLRDRFRSQGLRELADVIKSEQTDAGFASMKSAITDIGNNIMDIKSVTVGVNLDSEMNPKEAGLVSVNTEPFRSGDFVDRLLRWELKDNGYLCLAPLTALKGAVPYQEMLAINTSVNSALTKVMRSALKKCHTASLAFTAGKMDAFVGLKSEITFLLRGSQYVTRMTENGIPSCIPTIGDRTAIESLYQPTLLGMMEGSEIVPNDLRFDESGMVYILTGPNSGGKTVFVRAVGIAQALMQVGIPVPAKKASMKIADKIFVLFPGSATEGKKGGRLEEECKRIADMLDNATADSLVLMDETFSSTSAKDGEVLAESTIERLRGIGCRCIFSTHLHELASRVGFLNTRNSDIAKADTLAAQVTDGKRTYKILRGHADSSSDAVSIAEKYGII